MTFAVQLVHAWIAAALIGVAHWTGSSFFVAMAAAGVLTFFASVMDKGE